MNGSNVEWMWAVAAQVTNFTFNFTHPLLVFLFKWQHVLSPIDRNARFAPQPLFPSPLFLVLHSQFPCIHRSRLAPTYPTTSPFFLIILMSPYTHLISLFATLDPPFPDPFYSSIHSLYSCLVRASKLLRHLNPFNHYRICFESITVICNVWARNMFLFTCHALSHRVLVSNPALHLFFVGKRIGGWCYVCHCARSGFHQPTMWNQHKKTAPG